MAAEAYPLAWPEGWPRKKYRNTSHPFGWQLALGKAIQGLNDELRRLGAKGIVISSNLTVSSLGQPYAKQAQSIPDPGVAVYFHFKDRPHAMARDEYTNVAANIRSLALAIEGLRQLERHGGAYMMERAFSGFSALPPPDKPQAEAVDWRVELGPLPDGLDAADLLIIAEKRYRDKARTAHSDTGGDDAKMIRLNAAIADARKELA